MSEIIEQDIQQIVNQLGKDVNKFAGKTLLISGGTGFLGSYFILTIDYINRNILKKPCKVISLDNYITSKKKKIFKKLDKNNFIFIKADVSKDIKIYEKIDFVIHAAGLASPIYYQKFPIETIESAIFGAKNLLEISRRNKVKSFLFFSSSEIYGNPDEKNIPTKEDYKGNVSSIGPRACYDESKRLAETLSIVYFQKHKVPVKIVRPFNIYGPGMSSKDFRVIPNFITRALHGETIEVHKKGIQTRSFCYISDAMIGFFKVLISKNNGEVFNVGNDSREISIIDLANLVSNLFKKKIKVNKINYPLNYPQDEPVRRSPDLTKIRNLLNYNPSVSLEEGLNRIITWYKEDVS
jgi:nucleoside-diphosphate-sugar epimerase